AGCLVFPTLYEGFGLPILEAMASGTPVLTSTTGAAPEITGGLAVIVDPYDVEAIADGIDRALETPATVLAQAREHARTFTWERCANQTLAMYRRLILCNTRQHHTKTTYQPPTGLGIRFSLILAFTICARVILRPILPPCVHPGSRPYSFVIW